MDEIDFPVSLPARIENVVFVEMKPRLPNASSWRTLIGHGVLTAASKAAGTGLFNVTYLSEPLVGEITPERIKKYNPDIVGFTAMSPTISRVLPAARKLSEEGIPVMLGGDHVSLMPVSAKSSHCADYIFVKESEMPVVQLLNALNGNRDLSGIPNLIYKTIGGYVENQVLCPDGLSTIDFKYNYKIVEGLDSIKKPRSFEDLRKKILLQLPLQTTRGCPHGCHFCVTSYLLGKTLRRRPADHVLSDIENGLEYTKHFMIVDNIFGVGKETEELLEKIITNDYGATFSVLARQGISKNIRMLQLMKKAGVNSLSIGIEAVNDNTLSEYGKGQTVAEIEESLRIIHGEGFSILGLFVVGGDYDDCHTVEEILDFVSNNQIERMHISPLSIFPTLSVDQIFPLSRLIPGIPPDCYDGHHVFIFPKQIRPSVLQEQISEAYKRLYSAKNICRTLNYKGRRFRAAVDRAAVGFGEKSIAKAIEADGYVAELRRIEAPFYKGNLLMAEKLTQLPHLLS